jgi:hypothetical protein
MRILITWGSKRIVAFFKTHLRNEVTGIIT